MPLQPEKAIESKISNISIELQKGPLKLAVPPKPSQTSSSPRRQLKKEAWTKLKPKVVELVNSEVDFKKSYSGAFLSEITRSLRVSSASFGDDTFNASSKSKSSANKYSQTLRIVCPQFSDVRSHFNLHEDITENSLGVVKRCSEKLTGKSYLCRVILKANLSNQFKINELKDELKMLEALESHSSVVDLVGIFEDIKSINIVTELCTGNNLSTRIQQKGSYPENEAALICKQLASALALAHEQGILYRDLKPESILLLSNDSETDVRLADFSSAAKFKPGQKLSQLVGNPLFTAPSVFQLSYGTEADLWSLGVILHLMLGGVVPFNGNNMSEIYRNVQNGVLDLENGKIGAVSREAKDLISLLLSRNSEGAISARDVLDHPWIKRFEVAVEIEEEEESVAPLQSDLTSSELVVKSCELACWKQRDVSRALRRRISLGMLPRADPAPALAQFRTSKSLVDERNVSPTVMLSKMSSLFKKHMFSGSAAQDFTPCLERCSDLSEAEGIVFEVMEKTSKNQKDFIRKIDSSCSGEPWSPIADTTKAAIVLPFRAKAILSGK